MKKLIVILLAAVPMSVSAAAKPLIELEAANVDLRNTASLQRGAALFVNNCMGCHSIQYMRWDRVGRDLGLSVEQVQQYLQTTGERPGDLMRIAMPALDSAEWFGIAPPDLSLVTRARGTLTTPGTDWLYNLLLTFYIDESRPMGVNNLVFPDIGMPHPLWHLQGMQRAVFDENGRFERLELVSEGSMTPDEYGRAARDLTAFLAYIADPVKVEREALGSKVILFLLVFLGLAWMLKREYWKDVS